MDNYDLQMVIDADMKIDFAGKRELLGTKYYLCSFTPVFSVSYYSVAKTNLHPPRHVDFGDKNALLDQNFGFAWST